MSKDVRSLSALMLAMLLALAVLSSEAHAQSGQPLPPGWRSAGGKRPRTDRRAVGEAPGRTRDGVARWSRGRR